MVGVQAEDGKIRIMGSAAFVFANANLKDEPPFKRFMTYHESLPESAITPRYDYERRQHCRRQPLLR